MNSHLSALCTAFFLLALPFLALTQTELQEVEHTFHRHHFSVFSGATSQLGESGASRNQNTWHTLGLDYAYRINRQLGIGIFSEYLFASHEEFLFGLPVFLHIGKGFKVNASPLLALVYETKEPNGIPENEKIWHSKYGYRLEAAYDFKFGRYSLTPTINFDRVDGEPELNYGFAFGVGF